MAITLIDGFDWAPVLWISGGALVPGLAVVTLTVARPTSPALADAE
ncbi:hypothetical protein [Microbacterium foliorum]|nr:hypothetical protein [Microbacterium foliorum]